MPLLLQSAVLVSAALFSLALQFPLTGDDGGRGVRMRDAALVAIDDLRGRGENIQLVPVAGSEAVENPHQDEGTDNENDVAAGPVQVTQAFGGGARIIIGPLRSNVAVAELGALREARSVAISGTAEAPSEPNSRVFKLAPSERQLAAAAYASMRRQFGARICALDDGTADGVRRIAALRAAGSISRGLSCIGHADAVYFATNARQPVFCAAATARRAGPQTLLIEVSHRAFDPGEFAGAGRLFRAEPASISRNGELDAISERYHARAFVAADDAALRTYAAVQVAAAVSGDLPPDGDPAPLLRSRVFDTVVGPVRFGNNGDLEAPAIVIHRLN